VNLLKWIESWYKQQCNGDWEHNYGIKVGTLDNPGWMVDIDLIDTNLESKEFEKIKIIRSDNDWVHCFVTDNVFKGRGGAENLGEILNYFYKWVTS